MITCPLSLQIHTLALIFYVGLPNFFEKRGVSFTCIVSLDLDQIKEMKPPWQSNGVSIVYCSKYDTFIDIDDKSIKDT